MDEKELFLSFWEKEAPATRKVISRIPQERSDYKPDPMKLVMLAVAPAPMTGDVGNRIDVILEYIFNDTPGSQVRVRPSAMRQQMLSDRGLVTTLTQVLAQKYGAAELQRSPTLLGLLTQRQIDDLRAIAKGARVVEYSGPRLPKDVADRTYRGRPFTYLFGVGDDGVIRRILRKMYAVRLYMRRKTVDKNVDEPTLQALAQAGTSPEEAEAIYKLTTQPTLYERFVLPPYHREMSIETWKDQSHVRLIPSAGHGPQPYSKRTSTGRSQLRGDAVRSIGKSRWITRLFLSTSTRST